MQDLLSGANSVILGVSARGRPVGSRLGIFRTTGPRGRGHEGWPDAAHRDDALVVVRSQMSSDWNLVLSERSLTGKQAADLKMMHNSVRKLNATPRGDGAGDTLRRRTIPKLTA